MIYFLSDVHLGIGEKATDSARESTLIQFLVSIKPHCERLFILGDLFDYWFEYGTVVPKQHIRTLAILADFATSGIPVDYLIGNHDFGHQTYFSEELGVHIHRSDIELTLHHKRFYLAHGDGKPLQEPLYPFLRFILRNPASLLAWRLLHPDIGVGLAARVSRKSRIRAISSQDYLQKLQNEEAGLEAFAEAKIKAGCDFVLMGHTHHPKTRHFSSTDAGSKTRSGLYVNTGDWLTHYSYAEFDGQTVSLRYFQTDLHQS